jgi:hypothetical protein
MLKKDLLAKYFHVKAENERLLDNIVSLGTEFLRSKKSLAQLKKERLVAYLIAIVMTLILIVCEIS